MDLDNQTQEIIKQIPIANLRKHPKNNFFFDSIKGEKWEDLLESVKVNGIISPITVTPTNSKGNNYIVVSGHQRVRAAATLKMKTVPCYIKEFENEDEILLALIDANIQQRNTGNPNPLKLGRCLNELDRLYGIKRGNNQYSNPKISDSSNKKSKKDIADALNLSQDTLRNYQQLTTLNEFFQQKLLNNEINLSLATKIAKTLDGKQQEELYKCIQDNPSKNIKTIIERFINPEKAKKAVSNDKNAQLSDPLIVHKQIIEFINKAEETIPATSTLLKEDIDANGEVIDVSGYNWSRVLSKQESNRLSEFYKSITKKDALDDLNSLVGIYTDIFDYMHCSIKSLLDNKRIRIGFLKSVYDYLEDLTYQIREVISFVDGFNSCVEEICDTIDAYADLPAETDADDEYDETDE